MPKDTTDLSVKHFSRYGEFLASFELSKHRWDTYTPVYDEYIDLVIHKTVCAKCKSSWNTNPKLKCDNCGKEITSLNKNRIKAQIKCKNCQKIYPKKTKICPNCGDKEFENYPTCPFCSKGLILIDKTDCRNCGSDKFIEKFRTIQVKSSRLEKGGNTYAVDLRPRDFTQGKDHYYVWVCIDKDQKPNFIVLSVTEFKKISDNFIKSISFLKDEGREHFNAKTFGKYAVYLNAFDLLE